MLNELRALQYILQDKTEALSPIGPDSASLGEASHWRSKTVNAAKHNFSKTWPTRDV